MEGLKFVETYTPYLQYVHSVKEVIFHGRSKFQQVDILDLHIFGRTLFLDHKIQSAEMDEYIYHESLVLPGLVTARRPQKVLILGGGEGATLRDTLRFPFVERAVMVDIDGELVDLARRYLEPWHQGAFEDPRTELIIDDARKFVFETRENFDLILSDLTEPVEGGPSRMLFTVEFYRRLSEILSDDGVLVVQSGSADPTYLEFFASLVRTLKEVFPVVRPYWAFVYSFQSPWAFTLASRNPDPLALGEAEIQEILRQAGDRGRFRYYHPGLHRAMFALPGYVLEALEQEGRVLTDENPFVWEA